MALIICEECGKEISDQASSCPHCGYPVFKQPQTNQAQNTGSKPTEYKIPTPANTPPTNKTVNNKAPDKTPQSGMSIAALILSILGCTFIVGVILAIIDLAKKDHTKKHTMSVIALVISGFWIIGGIANLGAQTNSVPAIIETQEITEQNGQNNAVAMPTSEKLPEPTPEPTQEPSAEPVPTVSKEEFIASCEEIDYKTLARNPDQYVGNPIVLTVKIEQILQGGWFDDNQYYRVYTNDDIGWWMGDEYFMYDFRADDNTKLLQDDIIKVYAEFAGLETVTRALTDTKEEVPAIKAIYIELQEADSTNNSGNDTSSEANSNSGETLGQKNALQSANQYLGFSAFSYNGLIEQLEFEEYSHEDAVYAADNCGADWNEQAVKSAKQYMEFSSFSRDGLIEQLEFEGFTHDQAVYGVEENGY